MDKQEALISVKNMTFSRGERKIFDNVSLTVPKGKVTAIMGPSNHTSPSSGAICPPIRRNNVVLPIPDGHNIPTLGRSALYQVRQRMSMLFQSGALFTDMDVFDNVAFPLREHTQLPEELIRTLVLLKLEAVGLRGAAHLQPNELSGGMARRAALARSIALDPELIMYDEPFVGQDPITMGVLVELIGSLNQALGITSVIVSHDVPEVMSIADHVYLLSGGKVIGSGSPQELQANNDPRVRQFLDGDADGPVRFQFPAQDLQQELFGSSNA